MEIHQLKTLQICVEDKFFCPFVFSAIFSFIEVNEKLKYSVSQV